MGRRPHLPSMLLLVGLLAAPAVAGPEPRAADLDLILARYRRIAAAGGWGSLPSGPPLGVGDRSPRVRALRARLAATGDLETDAADEQSDPERYDASVVHAVEAFQRRHGLAADGVVGGRTRVALDVPVKRRIAQLELARQQRAVRPPAQRWVRVNIPSFSLEFIDGDRTVLAMPIVVGRVERPTPVFESAISSIVLHPVWTVPPDLIYYDLLPKIRRDPGYLASRGFEVYAGPDPDAPRLDPRRVDWSRLGRGQEEVSIRQRAGSGNGLGRFLFSMNNPYDVYLHDTPARELFRFDRRDFSSGCIRVADADGLAHEILRSDAAWSPEHLAAALARRETVRVPIRPPIPVRVVYHTAWVDEHGRAQFREDLYGEDGRERVVPDRVPERPRVTSPASPEREMPRESAEAAWSVGLPTTARSR